MCAQTAAETDPHLDPVNGVTSSGIRFTALDSLSTASVVTVQSVANEHRAVRGGSYEYCSKVTEVALESAGHLV